MLRFRRGGDDQDEADLDAVVPIVRRMRSRTLPIQVTEAGSINSPTGAKLKLSLMVKLDPRYELAPRGKT
jgi:hypothetical protein